MRSAGGRAQNQHVVWPSEDPHSLYLTEETLQSGQPITGIHAFLKATHSEGFTGSLI